MAKEIRFALGTTGRTNLYATIDSPAGGQRWNTATPGFEAYSAGNAASYAIALAEQGASGVYLGDFPPGILAAGTYPVAIRSRAGGSAAESDPLVGAGSVPWSGSGVAAPPTPVDLGSLTTLVTAVKAKTDNLPANPMPAGPVVLAAAGLDAIPVEAGINVRQALSPILAAAAGVLSGAGTGTVVIKAPGTTTTRINATVDVAGNRTATTLTLPG